MLRCNDETGCPNSASCGLTLWRRLCEGCLQTPLHHSTSSPLLAAQPERSGGLSPAHARTLLSVWRDQFVLGCKSCATPFPARACAARHQRGPPPLRRGAGRGHHQSAQNNAKRGASHDDPIRREFDIPLEDLTPLSFSPTGKPGPTTLHGPTCSSSSTT